MVTAEEKMRTAFVKAFGLPHATDVTKFAYDTYELWDSIAHMRLIVEIEAAFDIMLDVDDVIGLSSYLKAIEIVGKYGVTF